MTRPGPSAICLECWREGRTIVTDPTGYFNVPCLRHYDPKDANKSTGPITKAALKDTKP